MIKLHNTLTDKLEDFFPISPGKVTLYSCGPTIYDRSHIGNLRSFLFVDFLKRCLLLNGYEVVHVMNLTDVDDKTIRRSRERRVSLRELQAIPPA